MGVLFAGLDRVLYLINRCKIYEQLYPSPKDHSQAYENFECAVIALYVCLLRFLGQAVDTYTMNTASRTLQTLLNPNDVASFAEECDSLETRVEREVSNLERCHDQSPQQAASLGKILEELKTLDKVMDTVNGFDAGVRNVWKHLQGAQRIQILQWVSDIPYEDHHRESRRGRALDTCEWILQHEDYNHWRSSDESMILWLHGIPGAGKTKLVSRVVDSLMSGRADHGIAYFYCNHHDNKRRKPVNILRAFIKQLSISPRDDSLRDALVDVYKQKRQSGFATDALNVEECETLILTLVSAYPQTTLVLDALDESHRESRNFLLAVFSPMLEKSPNLKIFISSRCDRDIKHQLEKRFNIGVDA